MSAFAERVAALGRERKFLCVGLDPDQKKLPPPEFLSFQGSEDPHAITDQIVAFNRAIIRATAMYPGYYKPNIAFYERYGKSGLVALKRTIEAIREIAPAAIVIIDGKRADIGNTNSHYAFEMFEYLGVDATTIHAWHGRVAMEPFLSYKDKGVIVVVATSNKGAGEFQDRIDAETGLFMYQFVAKQVAAQWNENGNCAVVAGATDPKRIGEIRRVIGDMPILIPGIGTQGGDLEASVSLGLNSQRGGIIINSSSGVIHASSSADFAKAAGEAARLLNEQILAAVARAA